jgi:hypothetical protein
VKNNLESKPEIPPPFFCVCRKLLKCMEEKYTFTEFQVFDPILRQKLFHVCNELSPVGISPMGDGN